jgi:hypothetical protein
MAVLAGGGDVKAQADLVQEVRLRQLRAPRPLLEKRRLRGRCLLSIRPEPVEGCPPRALLPSIGEHATYPARGADELQ